MLRDVNDTDLPFFFEHQRDPEATRMAAFRSRERDAFMKHWRQRVLGNPANKSKTILVDGQVAGNVVAWDQDGKRLIGYWLGKEYWGRGIATRALREFLTQETTRPVYAWVAQQNIASIRVLEKSGFRCDEGTGRHTGDDGIVEILMKFEDG